MTIAGSLMLPLVALATVTTPPQSVRFEKGVYALKMSPNGKWIGSAAGDASIYNVATGENIYYDGNFLGIGKAIANNGMAVGDMHDTGTILYKGKTIHPPTLMDFWFCDINSITPDATRIAGLCNNPGKGAPTYVPFVCDLDADGNVSEPVILPYPKEDFFRAGPQSCTVTWMSDDGKTCLGQMEDWRGMYTVPIFYQEDENGQWTYTLPTKDLFNPLGIELPDNPWLNEPVLREPDEFISNPLLRQAYLDLYDQWIANGCPDPQPDFTAYMTDEDYAAYKKNVEDYNDWYYNSEKYIKEYVVIYQQVLRSTPSFSGNDVSLAPSGKYFLTTGGVEDENGDRHSYLYKIYTDGRPMENYSMPVQGLYPVAIYKDDTAVMSKGMRAVPDSYLFDAVSGEFTHMNDYLRAEYPEEVEWIEENFPYGTGLVLMNEDKTVFSGALTPDQFIDYDWDRDYYYHTYLIGASNISNEEELPKDDAGVESLVVPGDGVYRVYNLQGVKVMETEDAGALNSLAKGIYIVNGAKIVLK